MRFIALIAIATALCIAAGAAIARITVEVEPERGDSGQFQCGGGWVTFAGEAQDGSTGRFTFPVGSIRWLVSVAEQPDRELIIIGEETTIFLSPETAQAIRDCLHG